MPPLSFSTLILRSRRPVPLQVVPGQPRIQLMMLVASFCAQVFRVRPRQPVRLGSAVISSGVMASAFVLLQYRTALPPRYGHSLDKTKGVERNSILSLLPTRPSLSKSAQVRMRRQVVPPCDILPEIGHVEEPSQVASGLSRASRRPPSQIGCTLLTPGALKATVWKGVVVSAMPSPATLPGADPSSLKRSTTTLLKLGLAGFVSGRNLTLQS